MNFDTVILDADSLVYRCGFAADDEPVSHALHNLKNQINSISEELEVPVSKFKIYIKGEGNFRTEIATSTVYKGTRSRKMPKHYEDIRAYIKSVYSAQEVDGMEADDACSVELYADHGSESKTILAALDKDLWNTPGWHFNYHPKKWKVEYVTPGQADRNFILQMVTGDRSDNIPGLSKIPAFYRKAYTWLHTSPGEGFAKFLSAKIPSNKDLMRTVFDMYVKLGKELGIEPDEAVSYFLEQGILLWMTRELTPAGKPVLWKPPSFLLEDIL